MNNPLGTLAWALVVVFVSTLAAVVLVVTLAPADQVGTLVPLILGAVAPTAAVLVSLRTTQNLAGQVDQVAQDTHDLRNGLLDAKVRAGVADVLPDHMIDPDYLDTGQRRRDDDRRGEAD